MTPCENEATDSTDYVAEVSRLQRERVELVAEMALLKTSIAIQEAAISDLEADLAELSNGPQ